MTNYILLICGYILLILISLIIAKLVFKRTWNELTFFIALSVLVPILGFILGILIIFPTKKSRDSIDDFSLYENSSLAFEYPVKIDVELESNLIPLQDALYLCDSSVKRKLVIEFIKQDVFENIDVLKSAIQDKDTEASHYAASAILEYKKKFQVSLQRMATLYEKNKSDIEYCIAYADILKKYLNSNIHDLNTRDKYKYIYLNVLNTILNLSDEYLEYFNDKIDMEISIGEYNRAYLTCMLFWEKFGNIEDVYMAFLKFYFSRKDSSNFKRKLNQLRNSDFLLSKNSLDMIRFWIGEGV